MSDQKVKRKTTEWLKRYIPSEVFGTAGALSFAWTVYVHTHSYAAAAAAGLIGEGIGFYGYFVSTELLFNAQKYRDYPFFKRMTLAVGRASTNLLVEFAPAEIFDTLFVRPFAMYLIPHHIHPYPLGFLAGKFSADIVFYAIAVVGYEARKRWLR